MEYIQSRLRTAGCDHSAAVHLFPRETVARIHRFTGGIPRLINLVCENALLVGCANQLYQMTPDILDEIATNFRLTEVGPGPQDQSHKSELWQSVRSLLEFHDSSDSRNHNVTQFEGGIDTNRRSEVAATPIRSRAK